MKHKAMNYFLFCEKEKLFNRNNKKGLKIGAYMGILMGKYRGKVDGKKVMEILKNLLK